jgi:hypothetical protein
VTSIFRKGYFEFMAVFAHRKITKGKVNQKIHKPFSNLRQIGASGLSGNRLILIMSFPPSSESSQSAKSIAQSVNEEILLKRIIIGEIVRLGQNGPQISGIIFC